MPSAVAHFIVGTAIAAPLVPWIKTEDRIRPTALVLSTGVFAASPDLDTIFFGLIPYGHFLGHRGFFHSPFFMILIGLLLSLFLILMLRGTTLKNWMMVFFCFSVAGASHGLLDAMTDRGLGVMLAFPFSTERIFLPWRPFYAPPIKIKGLTAASLWDVLRHDLPLIMITLIAALVLTSISWILVKKMRQKSSETTAYQD